VPFIRKYTLRHQNLSRTEVLVLGVALQLDWVPEEALREVLEEIEKERRVRKVNKRRPTRKDLMKVIVEALSAGPSPQEFVDVVYEILEQKGFETKFTNVKRIWRTYEEMVKKGFIQDYLDVVKR